MLNRPGGEGGGFDRCELTRVQTQRYQYAYPGSWFLEHVRGIEVLCLPLYPQYDSSVFLEELL